jgi:dehydrogenase/reductase SDR family protein 12
VSTRFADLVDRCLEATIAGSFTRVGLVVRRRLEGWGGDAPASGKVIAITGATSGLGLAAARRWVAAGATVEIVARNAEKAEAVAHELGVGVTLADVGDLEEVGRAAAALRAKYAKIDVLVHNAGALDATWAATRQGLEQTFATHVAGPLKLTAELLPALSEGSRVLWVSSGGMYAEPLDVARLESPPSNFDGVRAYARAKRAQVTLSEMLAERLAARGVVVHAMHPGWADTPGVARSLPQFRRIVGAALRTPDEGADTLVWLAIDPGPATSSGLFWHDRRSRRTHLGARTRRSDTPEERARLWAFVAERAGISDAIR